MFTHPAWRSFGLVSGDFDVRIPNGAVLSLQLGYLAGAIGSDGVRFELSVMARDTASGRMETTQVFRLNRNYSRRWTRTRVDLSYWSGRDVTLRLQVHAGGSSGQDWAVWSKLMIEENGGAENAQRWRFAPTELIVEDRNERSGGGDDPMLAAVYFTAGFGRPGSTRTVVRDRLALLAENVDEHVRIPIDDADQLVIEDIVSNQENGISGYFLGAFEEDRNGRDVIRTALREISQKLEQALIDNVESDASAFLDADGLADSLEAAVSGGEPGGGAGRFKKWIGRAHDFVGLNGVIYLSGPIGTFADRMMITDERPVVELSSRDLSLVFRGADARYRVQVNARPV